MFMSKHAKSSNGSFHPLSAPDFLPLPQLRDLQLQRLKAIVQRAYDRVRPVPQADGRPRPDAAGRADAGGYRQAALCREDRPARHLSFRPVRQPYEGHCAAARLERHHGQAHRRGLHAGGYPGLDQRHAAQPCRLRAARGRHHPERLRLWPVHRRAGRALRRGSAGRNGHPDLRRQHPAPVDGDEGLRRHRDLLHAQLLPPPD